MKKNSLKSQHITQLLFSVVILLLLFYISSKVFFRVDLTTEKQYTLSFKTKEILSKVDDVVFIKVYLDGELPIGFKKLRNSVRETLDEFRIYAKDNIQYEFINPSESADQKVRSRIFNELSEKGLNPIQIKMKEKDGSSSERIIFPCALVSYNDIEISVSLLKNNTALTAEENLNNSAQNIEFELVKTISNLTNKNIDKIAFLEGHGELNELQTADITKELVNYYQVDRGIINGKQDILDEYKAIIIAKPIKPFSEQDKLIIDQYVMRGGKVIWFVDGVNVSLDSLANGATFGFISPLNLDDLLFTYGVRINTNLVQDIQCNVLPVQAGMNGNQPRWVPAPWLYYPLLAPLVQHPVTRDLNLVFSRFISTIDTVGEDSGIKKTVLLKTSSYTKIVSAPLFISLEEVKKNQVKEEFNKSNQSVAVLLEGQFKSVFRNRNASQIIPGWSGKKQDYSVSNKMILVADGDIIANDVQITPKGPKIFALGYDKYTGKSFANKEFVINAINYLVDENGLVELRSKEFKLRLLDKKRLSEEKLKWQLINTLAPVILVILFALFYQQRRKMKYT